MVFIEIEIDGFKFKLQYGVYRYSISGKQSEYPGVILDVDTPIDNPAYIKALHEAFQQYPIVGKVIDAVNMCITDSPDQFNNTEAEYRRSILELALSQKAIDIEAHREDLENFLYALNMTRHGRPKAHSYSAYLNSDHWKQTRQKALENAEYQCWECGSKDRLHVHHLTYENIGGELPEDLMVLCASCHAKIHNQ